MVLNKANLFDPQLVTDLINKVTGKSSIARLSAQQAIPFNGEKVFTFTMDSEIDVIAESGKKTHGGVSLAPQTMVPIKVEYGARISDEFMYASDEEKINILRAFNDGFAKKVARGIDLMAFHGVNPRQGTASAVIGTNNFDSKVTQKVSAPKGIADANGAIESAVELLTGVDADVTGIAINPSFRSALAKQKDQQGNALFPELKWGYAKEVPLEVIQFGDPDNSGLDLKGYNQVYIRAELYLGWGILDATKFARVTEAAV